MMIRNLLGNHWDFSTSQPLSKTYWKIVVLEQCVFFVTPLSAFWLRVVCFKSYHFTGEKIATDLWPTSTLSPDLWIKNWIPTMHYLPKQVAFSCTQKPENPQALSLKKRAIRPLLEGLSLNLYKKSKIVCFLLGPLIIAKITGLRGPVKPRILRKHFFSISFIQVLAGHQTPPFCSWDT